VGGACLGLGLDLFSFKLCVLLLFFSPIQNSTSNWPNIRSLNRAIAESPEDEKNKNEWKRQ
jgi:hypothetical protein